MNTPLKNSCQVERSEQSTKRECNVHDEGVDACSNEGFAPLNHPMDSGMNKCIR